MEKEQRKMTSKARLAMTILVGAVLATESIEAGSINTTSFSSEVRVRGDITDRYRSWTGPRYRVLGRFDKRDQNRSTSVVSAHNLFERGDVRKRVRRRNFRSRATARTWASSTSSPYIFDLTLGTQAYGTMTEPDPSDASNYSANASHAVSFDVDGLFDISLDWRSHVSSRNGYAWAHAYLYDLTDRTYLFNRRTRSNLIDGISDIELQDGHSYRLWVRSQANDLRRNGSSHAWSTVNLRIAEHSDPTAIPSPTAAFAGVLGMGLLVGRRRRR